MRNGTRSSCCEAWRDDASYRGRARRTGTRRLLLTPGSPQESRHRPRRQLGQQPSGVGAAPLDVGFDLGEGVRADEPGRPQPVGVQPDDAGQPEARHPGRARARPATTAGAWPRRACPSSAPSPVTAR